MYYIDNTPATHLLRSGEAVGADFPRSSNAHTFYINVKRPNTGAAFPNDYSIPDGESLKSFEMSCSYSMTAEDIILLELQGPSSPVGKFPGLYLSITLIIMPIVVLEYSTR